MYFRRLFLTVLLLVALASPAAAQTADEFFDNTALHVVRLYMHPSDLSLLRANFAENTYYLADFSWRGVEVTNVGVRSRGSGTRNPLKLGLRLDFNRHIQKQEFLGLSSVVLDNCLQDPSFLRERLSMLLFRRMGIPAPREAYARLYINDQYAGLYAIVESIDKTFLKRNLGENGGYLYEYKWGDVYGFDYLGQSAQLYSPAKFEPRTRESEPDPATIERMIRTINQASDADFIDRMSEFLDLRLFVKFVAIENFISEWDGILGYWGMNNFYLYRFEGTRRFQFIPWDKDITFGKAGHPIWFNVTSNVLVRRALKYPELYETYLKALEQTALAAEGIGGWLERELDRAYIQMQLAALEDRLKPVNNEEFEKHVVTMREFVRYRKDFVTASVFSQRRKGLVDRWNSITGVDVSTWLCDGFGCTQLNRDKNPLRIR
jgi:spore coat protein CotH